ncbi:MAG: type II toxin-antitoxin system VapC family toxin [Planctomycetaceae bacterium]
MTNPTLYLETSVIGYLTSRPSRDVITAGNQQITYEWWDEHRERFEIFISEAVVAECSAGDPSAAAERLARIGDIPVLVVSDAVEALAENLIRGVPLPDKAAVDALHIAVAAINGMDFLMTWNCVHIANAALLDSIESIIEAEGLKCPTICTPQQLMEPENDVA